MRYDVAVVGAGPAGAWTAFLLASRGARVLLADPSHPREKPCGGGVTGRALALVGPRTRDRQLPAVPIRAARFVSTAMMASAAVPLAMGQTVATGALVVASRADFDGLLLAARRARAPSCWRARHWRESQPGRILIETADGQTAHAARLVGADGANSLVRRRLMQPLSRRQLSIATGFFAHGVTSDEIVIELLADPPGYIWSFPRPGHLAIGICAQADQGITAGALRARAADWIRTAAVAPDAVLEPYSWPIPSLSERDFETLDVAGEGWLLAGDAAGLVDPITREGIFFALQSGTYAADALGSSASRRERTYSDRVRTGIGGNLRAPRASRRILYAAVHGSSCRRAGRERANQESHGRSHSRHAELPRIEMEAREDVRDRSRLEICANDLARQISVARAHIHAGTVHGHVDRSPTRLSLHWARRHISDEILKSEFACDRCQRRRQPARVRHVKRSPARDDGELREDGRPRAPQRDRVNQHVFLARFLNDVGRTGLRTRSSPSDRRMRARVRPPAARRRAPRASHRRAASCPRDRHGPAPRHRFPIGRPRREHFRLAADREHHHLIDRPERADERPRGGRRAREPLARHAEAAIESDRDRERKLTGRKRRDALRLAVLLHREICRGQPGHDFALGIGDRRVDLDQAHTGDELRRLGWRRARTGGKRQGRSCQQDEESPSQRLLPGWYNHCAFRITKRAVSPQLLGSYSKEGSGWVD